MLRCPTIFQQREMSMDPVAYKRWWALHIRVALGESLAEEDSAFYEAGKQSLDKEEELAYDDQGVHQARAALAALEAENLQLRARSEKLHAEIAAVERALDKKSKH